MLNVARSYQWHNMNTSHRGALRGIPGSPYPQPEPNATGLPSSTPGRPNLIELQASAPSPTPKRAEEHTATTPGCGPAGHRAFAHADTRRTSRRAADRAPPRSRPPPRAEENFAHRRAANLTALRALAHADSRRRELRHAPPRLLSTPTRAEEHLAVTPGCRPRAPTPKRAKRCLENRHKAYRANNGFRAFKERLARR